VEERRIPVRRLLGAIGAFAALLPGGAAACDLPPGVRVENARLAVSYSTTPARIEIGKPFVLELAVCPKGKAAMPERAKLDARMPEHRHGMNYRIKVVQAGAGRFHSEGWLFHMPGRWEFVFDLGPERLTHSISVE